MKAGRQSVLWELHWPLIAVVVLIGALGIYNLHSAAAARDSSLYLTQLYFMLIGMGLIALMLLVDYRISESAAYTIYGIVCVLLLAVLLQGRVAGGARRWLDLGPIGFQPSELAKVATMLCVARYFGQRVQPGGYSLGDLFRLLNPSRPLAVAALLAVSWSRPFLVDPLGEMARAVRLRMGATVPQVGDLLWFRTLLIATVVMAAALAVFVIVRASSARALLAPWPEGRRKRLLWFTGVSTFVLLVVILSLWGHPVVRDPFGVAMASLYAAAGKGGPYELLQPGWALRITLVMGVVLYAVASLLSLRRAPAHPVDLVVAPIDVIAVPFLLVLVEPDLGTAGVIALIGMSMVLVVGIQGRSLVMLGALGAIVSVVGWFGILKDYQKRRILTFIDPEQDVHGAGWNATQSIIAVGSGRWSGKGHMEGTQSQLSFLPEQHTDFAFSVWAEEQGFVGCALVLLLYFVLIAYALSIAAQARDNFGSLLATGVAALIAWQAFINVGMVIGVLPVVGLTLPLFSYGGSSVLTVMFCLGLLLNVHFRRRA